MITETTIKSLSNRLGNKNYVANAPAKIIQQTRDQLEEAKSVLKQIEADLARFTS